MAVNDDDEEGFGDFSFAPSNQTIHSNLKMTNGQDFTSSNNGNDDDDWGDFINSGGLPHTMSLPKISKPLFPFGSFADQNRKDDSEPIQPGSAPSRVNSGMTQWEKPKGALPLSIFGGIEEEEEEESGAGGPSMGDKVPSLSSNKETVDDSAKKKDGASGLNVNDLIANLYKPSERKNEPALNINGSDLDPHGSNSVNKTNKNEPNSNSHALDSNWNWLNPNSNVLNVNGTSEPTLSSQGLNMDWNSLNLGPKGLNSVSKGENLCADRVGTGLVDGNEEFDDDDDGWEFNGAESKTAVGTTRNEPNLSSQGLNLDWNPLNLNPNGSNSVSKEANLSKNVVSAGLVDGNEGFDDDDDDDGWEFKGAESETTVGNEISKIKTENGLAYNLNGFNMSWNALSLNVNNCNSNVNSSAIWLNMGPVDENRDLVNGDVWKFKDSYYRTQVGYHNSKDGQIKTENASNLNLKGSDLSWDMLPSSSSRLSSNLSGVNLDGKQLKSDLLDENKNLNDTVGRGFKSADPEFHTEDGNSKGGGIKTENGPTLNFNGSNSSWNVLSLDAVGMNSNLNEVNLDSKQVDGRRLENSEGAVYSFGFGSSAHGPDDLFGASQWTSQRSSEMGFGFNLNPSPLTEDGTISTNYSKSKQNDNENSLYFSQVDEKVDSDEDSWAFKDAFSEIGSKDKDEPKVAEVSAAVEAFAFDDEIKENKARLENHNGALPLSIFGDKEEEADDPVIYQDISSQMLTSIPGSSMKSPHLNISDLISSLYSQAEQNSSISDAQSHSENGFCSGKTLTALNSANDNDNFDDDSWEFTDAYSGTRAEDQASVCGLGESHITYSTNIELNDFVDFFSKLKKELHFVALHHLDDLKKARSAATSEDANVQAFDKDIQDLDNELHQDGIMTSDEVCLDNHSARKICLDEFVKVLQEPKFQVLDSEYQLSKKLPFVSNDLRSTVELIKHVASIVKIFELASREEQCSYVSTWSKMLSVCAQELKHGALIWKQSLEKNVQDQILSKPQGKRYILGLGEIYRVVEVLGSSARLYKPWVLASPTDSMGMFTLLSECSTLWSSSGLEEALQSMSDPAGFEYDESPKTLLESIKYIHDLDVLTLYSHVFAGQDPICRLSVLTAGTVPGMKTVIWNGEYYFLKVANFWANLMCSDPPNLPHIHVR